MDVGAVWARLRRIARSYRPVAGQANTDRSPRFGSGIQAGADVAAQLAARRCRVFLGRWPPEYRNLAFGSGARRVSSEP